MELRPSLVVVLVPLTVVMQRRVHLVNSVLLRMLQAVDDMPANFGFLAKGVGSETEVVEEQIKAGAAGI